MALKITVHKNHLPTCPSPFIVRSDSEAVVEYDKLVDLMAKGRTTLTKTDILGALQLYKEELQRQLAEGKTVKTPTGSFYLCAAGSLSSMDEAFSPKDQGNNHEVRLHHRAEKAFEDEILAELEIVREERLDRSSPNLRTAQSAGEEYPGTIRPGGIVQLKGFRLRFDPAQAGQGVFFLDSGGAETRSAFYPMVQPGTVLASVPETLSSGTYAVILRAAVNGKDVRESRLEGVVLATA
jgi:hypothetical protein